MIKNYIKAASRLNENWYKPFEGAQDLASLKQMVTKHKDLMGKQCKYMLTQDPSTIKIVNQILKDNQFLREKILTPLPAISNETQSLKVQICNLRNYPEYNALYNQWKSQNRSRILAVGGPAAGEQIFMASMIPAIAKNNDLAYYCRDHTESNVHHSANHSIVRIGAAMNSSSVATALYLFPYILKRLFVNPTLDEVVKSQYLNIDVNIWKLHYFPTYLGNEFNGHLQNLRQRLGQENEHDINRQEVSTSQAIHKVLERASNTNLTWNHSHDSKKKSMAINLIMQGSNLQQEIKEHIDLEKRQKFLTWENVPLQEIRAMFPEAKNAIGGLRYCDDFGHRYDAFDIQRKRASQEGAVWEENKKALKKVFIKKGDDGEPIACGVQFEGGEFIPADKIHLTLGYKAAYEYENSSLKPVLYRNVPATGVSVTLVIKAKDFIRKIIEQKGGAMQVFTSLVHWTTISYNDEYLLLRGTTGGNTGSENYKSEYFLNLIANTRLVFGDALVGVVSAYGCCRAVNYKNSTQFAQIAKGLVISHGKGGAGSSRRSSQAYKALDYLGYHKQLTNFFANSTNQAANVGINSSMRKIQNDNEKHNLFYSRLSATKKALSSS